MTFADYWKVLVLNLSVMENTDFFWVKKLMEKMIFTDYRKFLVLNFSVVGNTVFFWVKKLMEILYILVTNKLLFWTFRWWKTRSFFQPKKLIERWYLLGLFELSMIFQDLGNMVFRTVWSHKNKHRYLWLLCKSLYRKTENEQWKS